MMSKIIVIVKQKKNVLDPSKKALQKAVSELDKHGCKIIQIGTRYVLNFPKLTQEDSLAAAEQIAKELLANLVVQEYIIKIEKEKGD